MIRRLLQRAAHARLEPRTSLYSPWPVDALLCKSTRTHTLPPFAAWLMAPLGSRFAHAVQPCGCLFNGHEGGWTFHGLLGDSLRPGATVARQIDRWATRRCYGDTLDDDCQFTKRIWLAGVQCGRMGRDWCSLSGTRVVQAGSTDCSPDSHTAESILGSRTRSGRVGIGRWRKSRMIAC